MFRCDSASEPATLPNAERLANPGRPLKLLKDIGGRMRTIERIPSKGEHRQRQKQEREEEKHGQKDLFEWCQSVPVVHRRPA